MSFHIAVTVHSIVVLQRTCLCQEGRPRWGYFPHRLHTLMALAFSKAFSMRDCQPVPPALK